MAKISMISPKPRGTSGNAATALRWSRLCRQLGHRVEVQRVYRSVDCDCLVALHARRSAASIRRFRRLHPDRPLIVALTGTDLYGDLNRSEAARESLALATRLIVLQPWGLEELPERFRAKAVVIHQSALALERRPSQSRRHFDVAVLSHLRPVKDPLRAALAARGLPPESRVRILHAGQGLTEALERRARDEETRNPRYHWLGDLPRSRARRLLARSRLLVLSSLMEGGANVISEAAAAGTPVLASRIPGTLGLLGEDYSGYFEVRDTRGLTRLLLRAEREPAFYAELGRGVRRLKPLVRPSYERTAWRNLLRELLEPGARTRRPLGGGREHPGRGNASRGKAKPRRSR